MHVHAHACTRVHEASSLTGLVPERVQLTVHTTELTGTVPEPFHCDHIARWSARSGTSGRSGTGLNTGNWNGSGTVLVSNLWCEHGPRCTSFDDFDDVITQLNNGIHRQHTKRKDSNTAHRMNDIEGSSGGGEVLCHLLCGENG